VREVVALSPAATLERGYAIVQRPSGEVVRRAKDVSPGALLTLRLPDDRLTVRAEPTEVGPSEGRPADHEPSEVGRAEGMRNEGRPAEKPAEDKPSKPRKSRKKPESPSETS
jgi:exodeoxyribonuclease VII large subunit